MVKLIRRAVATLALGVALSVSAAEPADNDIKAAFADISRYEQQFGGATEARASNVNRDIASATKTLDEGGPKPFQDAEYTAERQRVLERLRQSLTRFDAFPDDPDVVTATQALASFVIEQRFERGETLLAAALVRARFLSRTGERVTPAEILALVGVHGESPSLPEPAARGNAEQASSS